MTGKYFSSGKRYSRVEVIGEGREFVGRGEFVATEQDNGRTLKVFVIKKEEL